ncbi:MAG: DUF1801 domain-containing protein [Saprospiraceae bacterium]|nr:DUF1801 domain-containing protein [Saprospiraceae bacterium]
MKFQNIHFHSLDAFFEYLPKDQKIITESLRDIVMSTLPDVKEKLSYNVPFYALHKRIAFIWPGAVPWGKTIKEGVELGFTLGYLLPENTYLNQGNRKQVFIKTIYSTADIREQLIRDLLLQSAELDQLLKFKS